MNTGAFLFSRLSGQTSASNRITPLLLPQQPTYPAITYQQVSAITTHAMGGDAGVTRVRLQVDCWGSTYEQARTLATEVEACLSRFKGVSGGVKVLDVLFDNEMEFYESAAQSRRVMQEYTIFVSE